MSIAFTHLNLDQVEDAAPGNGFGERWQAQVAREDLVKLGDEIRPVRTLDAIRIAPEVPRAFEAGPEGLELIACGAHHPGDGEPVDDDWVK
jgi:hypothetical protein